MGRQVQHAALVKTEEFLMGPKIVHLSAGGEAPVLRRIVSAFEEYAKDKGTGAEGRSREEAKLKAARSMLSMLLRLSDEREIAFLASVGHALGAIAQGLVWKEGDNVVILNDEFSSCIVAWASLKRLGVALRLVSPGADPEGALLAAVDGRTRILCVSHVSYLHGRRVDLRRLAEGLRSTPVALVVDASHSLGVIDIPPDGYDALVSCGHKFLLGTHGTGILVQRTPKLGSLPAASLGWFSLDKYVVTNNEVMFTTRPQAGKLELGNPDFPALYALTESLAVLSGFGLSAVERHAMELSGELRRVLAKGGLPVITPAEDARRGSSIAVRSSECVTLARALAAEGIYVMAGEGRVRISVHLYNSMGDIETVLDRIAGLWR
jgi:selenocysteine lyase/cysteine desulfurase